MLARTLLYGNNNNNNSKGGMWKCNYQFLIYSELICMKKPDTLRKMRKWVAFANEDLPYCIQWSPQYLGSPLFGKNWLLRLSKKKIQYFAPLSKLIREIPLF